jgi:flagellar biosynthesis/type III secretory pathway chaperone
MMPLDANLTVLNQQLESFLALLEEEALALASGNSEQLETLTQQRLNVSLQLAEDWRRLPALRLRAFSDSAPTANWHRLEKLTHAAAQLNRVNGRLIEEQMRRTQAAMQVLQSASSRGLYGADGRMNDLLNTTRSIDSA